MLGGRSWAEIQMDGDSQSTSRICQTLQLQEVTGPIAWMIRMHRQVCLLWLSLDAFGAAMSPSGHRNQLTSADFTH